MTLTTPTHYRAFNSLGPPTRERSSRLLPGLALVNRLTAIDAYTRHRNSAACYQLAQSVLKIGSALAERVGQGEVGGCTALADSAWRLLQLADSAWRLLQLAIEKAWSALGVPLLHFLVQTSTENGPFTL